ncbi:ribosome hibernation-promoting factor, HPF/YfiA family [Anthocerotibacter panamensis]|uniref:ribosome hibernation-promoting factor, HPF/YfiA family n=1 Tax=Anthocerotibacter panamensis TaxID=2857077 RepID=UPI001C405868|nr:ribosome-associated translation inhibitor RaiA [Anthocerotibacter panamensis]
MKLLIHGKNIEVTEAIREYVERKVEKAVAPFDQLTQRVEIYLSVAHNPRVAANQSAEVTIHANGTIIRAEEASESLYASIDLVSDKIQRQLRKYKERNLKKSTPKTAVAVMESEPVAAPNGDRQVTLPKEVVRAKYFAMPPLSIEEALEQLHLVDHDFFVFRDKQTGQIHVLYERNHGGYGVIIPRGA